MHTIYLASGEMVSVSMDEGSENALQAGDPTVLRLLIEVCERKNAS